MAMHVLIADSDESILKRCDDECSNYGIALRMAKGGVECLDELRRRLPDVLVLDVDLPWGGGDGVLEIMRNDDALARVPVVLLDCNAAGSGGPGRFPANVVGRLVKPLEMCTLLDSVSSAADCRELFSPQPPISRAAFTQPARIAPAYQELARS